MLCTNCRRALLKRIHHSNSHSSKNLLTSNSRTPIPSHTRSVATVPHTNNAVQSTPPPSTTSPTDSPAAATSSSTPGINQPFSDPFFPSSTSVGAAPAPGSSRPNASAPKRFPSSVAGGTPLTGLMYTKASQAKPLLALEDDQYPPWLWTLLDAKKNALDDGTIVGPGGVDLDSMTKKMRAKYERKQAKLMANIEKPVPLHEQSKDLTGPGDDAKTSVERRGELTRSMREARRKGIRETNFLKSM